MSENSRRSRILYVSHTFPHQASFGGEMRCLQIARALKEIGTVDILHLVEGDTKAPPVVEEGSEFSLASTLAIKRRPSQWMHRRVLSRLDPRSDYPHGCGVEPSALHELVEISQSYDLIWFFRLRSPEMFPYTLWKRSVVDIDDLPTTYEGAAFRTAQNPFSRLYTLSRLLSWKRRERLLGERFSLLTVCSEQDRSYLDKLNIRVPIHVVPNGFETPACKPARKPHCPPRIGFVGLFDFFPNRDGVHWFINQCWPQIKLRLPGVRLRLVGQDTDSFLSSFEDKSIDRLGWIANTAEEMSGWSAMIVPIRVGAGTRIKIAHGFSQLCPVVSTTFGAYGYDAISGRDIFLADSAEEFARACIDVIADPCMAEKVAESAWTRFLERWTWDSIRPSVWAAAEDCLKRQSVSQTVA